MSEISFTIPDINISAQVGDVVFWAELPAQMSFESYEWQTAQQTSNPPIPVGGFLTNNEDPSTIYRLGTIRSISGNTITCNWDGDDWNISPNTPSFDHSFMFFAKDNKVNTGSVKGYYAEVVFTCNSRDKAEIFATTCDIESSSK